MNPSDLTQDEDKPKASSELLDELSCYWQDSVAHREILENTWARDTNILKGVPVEAENSKSKVTGKSKLYFRKAWSAQIRLVAAFFQAYMQDKQKFKIWGRDDQQDFIKAQVLEIMTKYHIDRLMRRREMFKKMIHAFMDCVAPGTAVIKQMWKYNEEWEIDEPDFVVYPLEQVILEWQKTCVSDMEYCGFENYLTHYQMEEMGYENIDKAVKESMPESVLRSARYQNTPDPLDGDNTPNQNYSDGTVGSHYPEKGTQGDTTMQDRVRSRYRAVEMFYRRKGKVYFCVFNPAGKVWLKAPEVSPYGRDFPISMGHMLLEAHKLIPESIIRPVEGPQEALNLDLNLRKDNQRLAMNGGFIYSRFGGVDKQALRNVHPGFTVAANDTSAVQPLKVPDVTQTSYMEASADMAMIDEMTGVNDAVLGNSTTGKTGEAQINLSQAQAKIDLFITTVGQTLFHQFIYNLAKHISLFETDERIFRIANERLRQSGLSKEKFDDVYDIEFDFDLEIDTGYSEASRAVMGQRYAAVWDRMLQSNNAAVMAMQAGVLPEGQKPQLFDIPKFSIDVIPQLGLPNPSRYLIDVTPPPSPEAAGGQSQSVAGQNAAQPNEAADDSGFMQNLQAQMGAGE